MAAADVRVVRPGEAPQTVALTEATALHELLAQAGVEPFDLDALDVVGDGERIEQLTRAEAFARADPPVLTPERNGVRYRGVVAERLDLELVESAALSVTATAAPGRVETGERVSFTAAVDGLEEDETATVRWNFFDGDRGFGAEVTHRFEDPGTYNVVVGATTPDDRAGADDIVTVTVTEPHASPTRTPTPTPSRTPAGTATVAPFGGFVPSGGGGGDGGAAPPPRATPTAKPKPTATATATATPAPHFGRRVEGDLIDTGALAAAPPAAAQPPPPTVPPSAGGGLSISPGAVTALAVLALSCGGFGLDMRRARARWS